MLKELSILKVTNLKQLKEFIKFLWKIYRKKANWVPPES